MVASPDALVGRAVQILGQGCVVSGFSMGPLVVVEQWCSLAVFADDDTLLSSTLLLAKQSRDRDQY